MAGTGSSPSPGSPAECSRSSPQYVQGAPVSATLSPWPPSDEGGSLYPGLGHRLLLVPSPCPALVARDPLSDPVGRPRLPLAAGSPSLSQIHVDVAVAGEVAALGVVLGVPIVSTCIIEQSRMCFSEWLLVDQNYLDFCPFAISTKKRS